MNLQLTSNVTGSRAVLSLDAAKAFDSVEWEFLWTILGRMGFGPQFLSYVRLLYAVSTAKIWAGDMLSNSFRLGRGNRQGCPLSPLLLALAIEPLACIVRATPAIIGFKCAREEERISLYADDLLLYLGDVQSSISPVMAIVREFGEWSGLRINWDKSVILPLDPLPERLSPEAAHLQVVSEFQYLGVMVLARPRDYTTLNVIPLLAKVGRR